MKTMEEINAGLRLELKALFWEYGADDWRLDLEEVDGKIFLKIFLTGEPFGEINILEMIPAKEDV